MSDEFNYVFDVAMELRGENERLRAQVEALARDNAALERDRDRWQAEASYYQQAAITPREADTTKPNPAPVFDNTAVPPRPWAP